MNVKKTILKLRKKSGLSQKAFARKVRMSTSWVTAAETGRIAGFKPSTQKKIERFSARVSA